MQNNIRYLKKKIETYDYQKNSDEQDFDEDNAMEVCEPQINTITLESQAINIRKQLDSYEDLYPNFPI